MRGNEIKEKRQNGKGDVIWFWELILETAVQAMQPRMR